MSTTPKFTQQVIQQLEMLISISRDVLSNSAGQTLISVRTELEDLSEQVEKKDKEIALLQGKDMDNKAQIEVLQNKLNSLKEEQYHD